MKISSARMLYETASVDYGEAIPWGDLDECTRKYWENFFQRRREASKKEKLDAYED
jgi:hypothetical protein